MGAIVPRIMIAGLSGDSGKTLASLSLVTALRYRGNSVATFKKGPDYIDAAWLGEAAQSDCRNLDTYMVEPTVLLGRFARRAFKADISVIEGNRGLYDGLDSSGTHSSASLAKLLGAPVILVVDATKTTRTVAAMVKGCQAFDENLNIAGVVLNRIAGERHRRVVTESIEKTCGIPVVGVFPKLGEEAELIPGRHLGLVTPAEFASRTQLEETLNGLAEKYLDIDKIIGIAKGAEKLEEPEVEATTTASSGIKIGYFDDSVFTFYYPENLEAIQQQGAELAPLSSLESRQLPEDLDALYIGGGFPETQVERLTRNHELMVSVKAAADKGMPIYAECGGLIYLSRSLLTEGQTHPMAGVLDIDLKMNRKPAGHGYVEMAVAGENPYFETGSRIKGHEFHYTSPVAPIDNETTVLKSIKGAGLGKGVDGIVRGKVMACYMHIHADGVPKWAGALARAAKDFQALRSSTEQSGENDESGESEPSQSKDRQGGLVASA